MCCISARRDIFFYGLLFKQINIIVKKNLIFMTGSIEYQIFQNHPSIKARSLWQKQESDQSLGMEQDNNNPEFEFLKGSVFSIDNLVYAKQVHGKEVEQIQNTGVVDLCDGLTTNVRKLPLLIRTADCASVMFYSPGHNSIANLHVGWRGARAGIIAEGIEKLSRRKAESIENMEVAVSPMIRGCCYEVGQEFYKDFVDQYLERRQGKIFLHLEMVIKDQLLGAGILSKNIEFSDYCTRCSSQGLPSYRRNKTRQRLFNLIELKEL